MKKGAKRIFAILLCCTGIVQHAVLANSSDGLSSSPSDIYILDNDGNTYIGEGVNMEKVTDNNLKGSVTGTAEGSKLSSNKACGGNYVRVIMNQNSADSVTYTYSPKIAGRYEVFVKLPDVTSVQTWGKISVTVTTGEKSSEVSFGAYKVGADMWSNFDYQSAGVYSFTGDGKESVAVTYYNRQNLYQGNYYAYFDDVKFVRYNGISEKTKTIVVDETGKTSVNGSEMSEKYGYVNLENLEYIGRDSYMRDGGLLPRTSSWNSSSPYMNMSFYQTETAGITAAYYPKLTAGKYMVSVYVPHGNGTNKMDIASSDANSKKLCRKYSGGIDGGFVEIGEYDFAGKYGEDYIKITSYGGSNGEYRTYFDAVKFRLIEDESETKPTPNVYAQIYVSPNGKDNATGTKNEPYQTIEKAQEKVRTLAPEMTGDIYVNLCGGTYYLDNALTLEAQDSGMNGYDVIYRSRSGEVATISGGEKLIDWQPHDSANNIWSAKAEGIGRQLFINGERKPRAAANEEQIVQFTPVSGDAAVTGENIYFAGYDNVTDIEIVWKLNYSDYRMPITKIEGNKIYFPNTFLEASPYGSSNVEVISIENAYEFLDEEGEWYLDKTTNTVYYKTSDIESVTSAVLAQDETLIEISGTKNDFVHNIRFENISFANTSWFGPENHEYGYPNFQAGFSNQATTGWADNFPKAAVTVEFAKDIAFNNTSFCHLGGAGMWLKKGCRDIEITDNKFYDISHNGIIMGLIQEAYTKTEETQIADIIVKNNVIHDVGIEYLGCVGICGFYTKRAEISHNEIYNIPYSGISLGYGWRNHWQEWEINPTVAEDNKIIGNHIYNVMEELIDGGGIYTFGVQPGLEISGNYVHDLNTAFGSAIYLDNGSRFVTVTGNAAHSAPCLLYVKGCDNVAVENYFDENYLTEFSFKQNEGLSELEYLPDESNGQENIISNKVVSAYPEDIINMAGLCSDARVKSNLKNESGKISGTVENISVRDIEDVQIYIASYDLTQQELIDFRKAYSGKLEYNKPVNINESLSGEVIKFMVWKHDMSPVCGAKTLDFDN